MEGNRGEVQTIARLVRWKVEKLDSMGPWLGTGPWLYCFSEPFKISIWEWHLDVAKKQDNQQVAIGLHLKSSLAAKGQPPVARLVFRLFDNEPGRPPYITPVSEKEFSEYRPTRISWPMEYTTNGPFIVDIEFADLKVSPASGEEQLPWIRSDEGMIQSLQTKTTLPCLTRLLEEGIHADITINTPGGVLKAHKALLSVSSPVFESMFLHHLKENETSTIDIEDMTFESCTALLRCMYGTIKQEELWNQRWELIVAADKYRMTNLKNFLEESLIEDIDSNNVLQRLQKAWINHLDKLKKACFKYLFDFGRIYEVRNEIASFIHLADKELLLELFQQTTPVQKPVYN